MSESGDSSKVTLNSNWDISSYPYTVLLNGASHVRFTGIGFSKTGTYWNYQALEIGGGSTDIKVSRCHFTPRIASGVVINGGADDITIADLSESHINGSEFDGSPNRSTLREFKILADIL
jgi:hypothetical protein